MTFFRSNLSGNYSSPNLCFAQAVRQAFQPDKQVRLESLTYGERRPNQLNCANFADYS